MPNGRDVVDKLEFLEHIKGLPDRELLEFVARQNYETSIECPRQDRRITSLEKGSRKTSGITGGATGGIIAAIVAIISYLRN